MFTSEEVFIKQQPVYSKKLTQTKLQTLREDWNELLGADLIDLCNKGQYLKARDHYCQLRNIDLSQADEIIWAYFNFENMESDFRQGEEIYISYGNIDLPRSVVVTGFRHTL